jgi:hypothetical protein
MALDIITGVSNVFRRDYSVPDAELPGQSSGFLNPNGSDPLVQGEWLIPNSSGQYIRSAESHVAADPFDSDDADYLMVLQAKCVFSVQGDYPAQALGKVTLIQSHGWEGETDKYQGTPALGDQLGLCINSDGEQVLVTSATGTLLKDIVVAVCTRGVSGGKIRFQAIQPYIKRTID